MKELLFQKGINRHRKLFHCRGSNLKTKVQKQLSIRLKKD
jgi:hypothetical protein